MDITERKYRLIQHCMGISTVEEIERAEYFFKHEIETIDFWDNLPEQVQKLVQKSKEQSKNDLVMPHETVIEKARKKIKQS
ncbi:MULTISPECIES: hypothetical protein [Aequorivita]|uniref:Uncharacterized protein n=2 Tax=Aequorivita TaxID=153265 RepID=A0AB35YTY8_9FLAO|nr:hypothetical protein [Aequorivita sp. Ant34-E75]WGF93938.1 hypothetical protein QCQ61_07050 [Aequorivita sp. Ant34-E75]